MQKCKTVHATEERADARNPMQDRTESLADQCKLRLALPRLHGGPCKETHEDSWGRVSKAFMHICKTRLNRACRACPLASGLGCFAGTIFFNVSGFSESPWSNKKNEPSFSKIGHRELRAHRGRSFWGTVRAGAHRRTIRLAATTSRAAATREPSRYVQKGP